jgi:ABC-type transport system involved in multi-copper enzyme maturation permease subunit
MIWLTWRQFRAQAWVTSAALAVLAVALAVTGLRLAHLYHASGIATCHANAGCGSLTSSFLHQMKANPAYNVLFEVGIAILYIAPGIIGIFWGAPLVTREVEAGTFRLAWNQSITRTRWLTVKLGLIGLAAMATAGLLSVMVTWWASPIDSALGLPAGRNGTGGLNRFTPLLFGARGITPIGYAAFAFALGVAAGVLIRHTVPAMATTLAVFAGVQITMALWVRSHLITPVTVTWPLNPANIDGLFFGGKGGQMGVQASVNLPGAWVLSNQTVTGSGHVFTGPAPRTCVSSASTFQACQNALGRLNLRQLVTYQPASRYWAFQWYETAIFAALALALAGFCFWWIHRRRLA